VEEDNMKVGVASAALVLVLGGVFYYYKTVWSSAPASPAISGPAAASDSAADAGEPLPKLEDSDAFVRPKAAELSSDPTYLSWLKTDDLLPRLAASLNMIGAGKVPKDGLSFMAPHKKFKARKRDDLFYVDPASYARYDAVAAAVASIDAPKAAQLFQRYKRLFQEAYQGLGENNGDVQDAFVRAARVLLSAPAAGPSTALKEKGLVYAYADESLESLSPAQKQLMRMGPKNEAKVQAKVRELALALGVPEARLVSR
jgi:hypothetical protein